MPLLAAVVIVTVVSSLFLLFRWVNAPPTLDSVLRTLRSQGLKPHQEATSFQRTTRLKDADNHVLAVLEVRIAEATGTLQLPGYRVRLSLEKEGGGRILSFSHDGLVKTPDPSWQRRLPELLDLFRITGC
jgi:hypothetical protein